MSIVIKIENVSKQYRLGKIGTGSINHDLKRWWSMVRGKEDPHLKIGEVNDHTEKGTSDLVWALRDINFEVKEGEVLGIIGKNGAGKSTLLKILSRTTAPTTGSVNIKGRIASLLEVGTGFHPELTGRENIFLNGAILGMRKKEIQSKFDEIVDFSGVEKYIDTPVKRYSSGMYVRLAFAVAAHLEPEILIIDEVLAVGDAEFQRKCLGKMKDVSGQGRTVLFVSHNMEAVRSLCQRVVLIRNGNVIMDGNTDEVINKYFEGSSELMSVALVERKDRKGSQSFSFVNYHFADINGIPIEFAVPGKPFMICLEVAKKSNTSINAKCSIGIHDKYGVRLTTLSNELTGAEHKSNDNFIISFLIENMSLYPGEYKCNVFLANHDSSDVVDWIQNAFTFNVVSGDFYSTGKTKSNQGDKFFTTHSVNFK